MNDRRSLKVLGVAFASILLIAGCRTAPIYNVKDAPVNVPAGQQATLTTIEHAIVRAGNGLGWQMKVEKPGLIVGTLNVRSHIAVVDIPFSTTSFSILYRSSVNLNQQDDRIHSNYNGRVRQLDQAIRNQLLGS